MFDLLDGDGDGFISLCAIDVEKLSEEIAMILLPIF